MTPHTQNFVRNPNDTHQFPRGEKNQESRVGLTEKRVEIAGSLGKPEENREDNGMDKNKYFIYMHKNVIRKAIIVHK